MKFIDHKLVLGVVCLLGSLNGIAQQLSDDVLLFGQTNVAYGSTARMQGVGGAMVSLGADMSVVGVNPAGLGFFNRSVFSFSPSMNFHDSNSEYFGNSSSTYRNNFNFSNLGIVFNSNKGDYTDEKFKGGSFAISLSKLNDFNNEEVYSGRNPFNSIADYYVDRANAIGVDMDNPIYDVDYAWRQFLIENADSYDFETGDDGRQYITPQGDFDGYTSLTGSLGGFYPNQYETIKTSGNQYAFNLAWGGNYNDKVYFGAGLSFESINYTKRSSYGENSFQDFNGQSDDLLFEIGVVERRKVTGSGIGFNGGVIVRPSTFITLGLSYKSPTFYSLKEESEFRLFTDWNTNYTYYSDYDQTSYDLGYIDTDQEDDDKRPPLFVNEYNLRTPGRLSGGATVFLGKIGFISGDVEYMDYTSGHVKSNDLAKAEVDSNNESIGNIYSNTLNFRLGSEFRYDLFRIRAGYGLYGNPYADDSGLTQDRRDITFGLGVRQRDFFIDVAYVNRKIDQDYFPYSVSENAPIVQFSNVVNSVTATVGFNF